MGEDAPEGAGEEAAASADTSLQVEVGHVTSLAVCFHVFLSSTFFSLYVNILYFLIINFENLFTRIQKVASKATKKEKKKVLVQY